MKAAFSKRARNYISEGNSVTLVWLNNRHKKNVKGMKVVIIPAKRKI